MSSTIWIVLGVAVLLVLVWRVLQPSLDRAVDRAMKADAPEPLVQAILQRAEGAQPDAFNHAIRRLWDAYRRELAMPVIRALVEHHPDESISQYWLDQARGVEPELTAAAFEDEFFEAYFRAEVAAACGKAG